MGGMQYPATAMVMMQQQMMMYPQHYMAAAAAAYNHHPGQYHQAPPPPPPSYQQYHQKQQQQQLVAAQSLHHKQDEIRTIWSGDLFHWMDESYLHSCFAHTGQVLSVKVIRNKQTGQSEGYGFIEFYSRAAAEKVLQSFNGTLMPNTEQPFRLNWATFSTGEKRSESGSDISIFVGDLAADVTDAVLQETFSSRFTSVKAAKVVIDSNTGRSKGYGFVRFSDENERSRAISEMNGVYCSSRPMRVGVATPKKSPGYLQQYNSQALVLAGGHGSNGAVAQGQPDSESKNTTSAENAIQTLNGTVIGKQTVRLSWGRTPGNKQWRGDSGNQWNGAHHGGYGGYGYAVPQHAAAVANGAS
ncbi:hypothetical protein TIFTF001_006929 [Ficus carica]|uniref:RRM domain-containing protein n=1 Tax=Ficus carica TaxID=3494 RepID=A0AA87ZP70_FICCA|nr:hypothetical protein TIFTF001_006929 [Ficus carica]